MKKWLLAMLLLAGVSHADNTYTTNAGIPMPADGDSNWGATLRSAFGVIDSSFPVIPIDLGSEVTGTLGSNHMVSTVAYTNVQNVFSTQQNFTTVVASSASFSGNVNVVGLTANQCVQAGAGGLLTTSGAACGGGGSGSALAVNQNSVQITSPTKALNGLSPPFLITSVGSGATAQFALDGSSVTLFGNNVIKLQSTLQPFATFYVSSGTIAGSLRVSTVTVVNNLTADNIRVTGTGGLTVDGLTSGRCVRATTGGLLTVATADCNVASTNYSQSFTAQTSVVLAHNTNTTNIVVSCYDNSTPPLFIGFNSLALTDTNSATVTFATAQTGTCVVASAGGGSGDNLGNHTATTMLTAGYGISASTISTSGAVTIQGASPILSTSTLQSATFFVSSGTVQNVTVSTLSWVATSFSGAFAAERCGREVQFTVTTDSSTTQHVFVPTHLSGSITPHSTASYIKVRVNGILKTSATTVEATATIFRGGVNILSSAGCDYLAAAGAAVTAPMSCNYTDSPASVSALTYAVAFKEQSGAGTATFCSNTFTCILSLQECF